MPNDFASLDEVADRLLAFQRHYQNMPTPSSGESLEAT